MEKMEQKVFAKLIMFIILLISTAAVLIMMYGEPMEQQFTTSYQNVTVAQAQVIISQNATVVDCRGLEGCAPCQFNKGHLPNATMINDYIILYNSTNDILVYSINGTMSSWFCEHLVGHVYGKIYNLEGGWNGWR